MEHAGRKAGRRRPATPPPALTSSHTCFADATADGGTDFSPSVSSLRSFGRDLTNAASAGLSAKKVGRLGSAATPPPLSPPPLSPVVQLAPPLQLPTAIAMTSDFPIAATVLPSSGDGEEWCGSVVTGGKAQKTAADTGLGAVHKRQRVESGGATCAAERWEVTVLADQDCPPRRPQGHFMTPISSALLLDGGVHARPPRLCANASTTLSRLLQLVEEPDGNEENGPESLEDVSPIVGLQEEADEENGNGRLSVPQIRDGEVNQLDASPFLSLEAYQLFSDTCCSFPLL